jgi:1,4-alpha-glucan branching enzyme
MSKTTLFYNLDPYLKSFGGVIDSRLNYFEEREKIITSGLSLSQFASGHFYYGMHKSVDNLVFREWAPNATAIFLVGEFNNWNEQESFRMKQIGKEGNWELIIPSDSIKHGDLYKLSVHWAGGSGLRLPSYAKMVVQDEDTKIFSCNHWMPDKAYNWKNQKFNTGKRNPLIYEAHIGMSSEEEKVSSFDEFKENVLPRIAENGYNTIQLMAIQEHPYYGSFGYHVSNLFAVSSRFGTPDDLKKLIDAAHSLDIAVIIDLVHSHAVSNVDEGLGLFAGDPGQYFHTNDRRIHSAWDSLCYDYGKPQVIHFLLSNCKYWMEEYKIDGFRFDGITSMIYYDHGLERDFTSYNMYFDGNQDKDALTYLHFANKLIHEIRQDAITIAEEMSGMPGLAASTESGGIGFDYRLAMGNPDYWIKLIKEVPDEEWDMGSIFYELTRHRIEEKTISYCESHDQALVGDKTLIFRLIDADMYYAMNIGSENVIVDRGTALHKMIRLVTLATAQSGYLNFMGNEFGHPEWIDFPREGNNWSYKYARRQWSLAEDEKLRYQHLYAFDKAMIAAIKEMEIFQDENPWHLSSDNENKVLAFKRGKLLFIFNFHPSNSYTNYGLPVKGQFRALLNSDDSKFGGFSRIDSSMIWISTIKGDEYQIDSPYELLLYLPSRTALVLEEIPL